MIKMQSGVVYRVNSEPLSIASITMKLAQRLSIASMFMKGNALKQTFPPGFYRTIVPCKTMGDHSLVFGVRTKRKYCLLNERNRWNRLQSYLKDSARTVSRLNNVSPVSLSDRMK